MEAEKQRLLSEQITEEEERIRRKMEKLKNREKKKKENGKPGNKPAPTSQSASSLSEPLQKGDLVSLPNKTVGELVEINGENAVVALGNLRANAKLSQLKRVSANQAKKMVQPRNTSVYANIRENISQKRMEFKPDIDVRGMRGDEALQRVIDFIDQAVMLDSKDLRILHGTGTGALRQIIRQYLSTNPVVASYADEQVQLGGAGITVVKLDI